VLEFASSFGYSAIDLAKRYRVRVVGVEKNLESVARAQANVAAAGLSEQITIVAGDIFHLEQINFPADCSSGFDYVLAEAILTMQSSAGKAKLLKTVYDRLKPGGKFLSHELLVRAHEAEIQQALARAIRVNAQPLSELGWVTLFETAGLHVQQHQMGAMGLLSPQQLLQDEGIFGTTRIVWNLLSQPKLRSRVFAMRRTFQTYNADLGHIILCAQRV
jgi:predicted O-methyltransferase YrrM